MKGAGSVEIAVDAATADTGVPAVEVIRRGGHTRSEKLGRSDPPSRHRSHCKSTLHLPDTQQFDPCTVWHSLPVGSAANEDMATPEDAPSTLDGFLASVERQAFVMAKRATGDSDVALDLVQEAMYRLVDRYGSRDPSEWRPLFFTILQHQITDHHRPRGMIGRFRRWFGDAENTNEAVDQLTSETAQPTEIADADKLGDSLLQALEQLPPRQHQAFMLRQWQGLSVAETARAMSVSEGSVKTHLSRALAHLRNELEEYRQ